MNNAPATFSPFRANLAPEPCETPGCSSASTTCISFRGGFSLHCAAHGASQGEKVTALKRSLALKSISAR